MGTCNFLFYFQPIQLAFSLVDVCRTGKIPSGLTEIPFEIPLVAYRNRKIYETYHGVYVNIRYKLKCDIKRGFLGKNECKEMEFIVELPVCCVVNFDILYRFFPYRIIESLNA